MVNNARVSKKVTHILITLISSKTLLKPTKIRHHWTTQLMKSTKIFGVCRVNETKVTDAYLQCSRNEAFYRFLFVETDFVSGYTDEY